MPRLWRLPARATLVDRPEASSKVAAIAKPVAWSLWSKSVRAFDASDS
jgi:hypothetical protein